ncbi:hypothetical protein C0995_008677 [Termitomyces sp. Mi166|nr:hypothetical protein C0995_008677 [Termitomyces sp. Mi166\
MPNSSETVVDTSHIDVQAVSSFESMTNIQDHDWTFRIFRETERAATPLMGRLSKLPEDDDVDDLVQCFGSKLSLFGRTKEQVVLDPSLQLGSSIQFKYFMGLGDGQVPIVTLDDIKGSKVVIPPSSDDYEDYSSPGAPFPPMGSESVYLSHDAGVFDKRNIVSTVLDILPQGKEGETEVEDQQRILAQSANSFHGTTDAFPAFHNYVIPSDIPPLRTSSELRDNDKALRDIPTLHLTLEGIDNNPAPTDGPVLSLVHTDTRSEQVAAPGAMTNPLLRSLLDTLNEALNSSSVEYPFEETPARDRLPFPFGDFHPISQTSQDLQVLFDQVIHAVDPGNLLTDPETLSYNQYDSFFSSDWSIPPSLSPSYTDSSVSQDSALYTPTSGRSPISLSFAPSQPFLDTTPFLHSLPTQDVLANTYVDPALLTLDKVHFEEPFPAFSAPEDHTLHRTNEKAAQVHELIKVQLAPYPIGPPVPKPKTAPNNHKGKCKAKAKPDRDDGDSDEARGKEHKKKKKKRDEADKVRCEIDGCNGTFFSNWELKRHQKNLHGGEETRNMAVCHKCGRHFASGRKDSVDRHLELNACGKRNPRKSPKRFASGQTS